MTDTVGVANDDDPIRSRIGKNRLPLPHRVFKTLITWYSAYMIIVITVIVTDMFLEIV